MRGIRLAGLIAITVVVTIAVMSQPPIAQPASYHRFADDRALLGVPSFLNVVSNVVYVLAGGAGLWVLLRSPAAGHACGPLCLGWADRVTFGTLFLGVLLTAFGSTWYHLGPCNATLVWDRLPMTVAFMGFACGLVADRINARAGAYLLLPLVALGIASVLYWNATEQHGAGDLRPYILVQAMPLLLVPYIAAVWPGRYLPRGGLFIALGWYVLGKVLEVGDGVVFALGGVLSGHTLKHLATAVGVYWVARAIRRGAGGAGRGASRV